MGWLIGMSILIITGLWLNREGAIDTSGWG